MRKGVIERFLGCHIGLNCLATIAPYIPSHRVSWNGVKRGENVEAYGMCLFAGGVEWLAVDDDRVRHLPRSLPDLSFLHSNPDPPLICMHFVPFPSAGWHPQHTNASLQYMSSIKRSSRCARHRQVLHTPGIDNSLIFQQAIKW